MSEVCLKCNAGLPVDQLHINIDGKYETQLPAVVAYPTALHGNLWEIIKRRLDGEPTVLLVEQVMAVLKTISIEGVCEPCDWELRASRRRDYLMNKQTPPEDG